ncbi:MAG: arnT 2 [Bacteroidetes bacterium]|nr:arnT 2 [Bacteroidota bacterium]
MCKVKKMRAIPNIYASGNGQLLELKPLTRSEVSVWKYNLAIVAAALVLFVPFLGSAHLFDWDEINFAECAREMLVTHNYFSVKINFQPFWEKPPLFIWMQALSMSVFGINAFAARLPDAICGIITLLAVFNIGRKIYNERFGLLWMLAFAGSFLPHFFFKSGIIDPWFNLFIFCSIYYFIIYSDTKSVNRLLLSAVFIGLAVLTKGPAAVLILGLCLVIYRILMRFEPLMTLKHFLIYSSTAALVGGAWLLLLLFSGHAEIISQFFIYQVRLFSTPDAGHGGPFYYHWIVLLVGCFPMSVFALRGFKSNAHDTAFQRVFKLHMMILFWVVLILFSIVKTKIVHYSSLCYFPMSFLAAYTIHKLINGQLKWKKASSVLMMVLAGLFGIVVSALPLLEKYKQQLVATGLVKDKMMLENLKANVHWLGFEWLIGVVFIIGTAVMLFFITKGKIQQGAIGIFLVSMFTVNISSLVIAPRVEQYTQGAAIEFYEYLKDKDCYVETYGFKSYAYLFYPQKKEDKNPEHSNIDWMLRGNIDKPAYFASRITDYDQIFTTYKDLKEIYRKNGFVFWVRYPGFYH